MKNPYIHAGNIQGPTDYRRHCEWLEELYFAIAETGDEGARELAKRLEKDVEEWLRHLSRTKGSNADAGPHDRRERV